MKNCENKPAVFLCWKYKSNLISWAMFVQLSLTINIKSNSCAWSFFFFYVVLHIIIMQSCIDQQKKKPLRWFYFILSLTSGLEAVGACLHPGQVLLPIRIISPGLLHYLHMQVDPTSSLIFPCFEEINSRFLFLFCAQTKRQVRRDCADLRQQLAQLNHRGASMRSAPDTSGFYPLTGIPPHGPSAHPVAACK